MPRNTTDDDLERRSEPTADGRVAGISIYTGASLGDVGEIMSDPELPAEIPAELDFSAVSGGAVTDVVFRDSRPDGFSLANLRLAPGYVLPNHRHDVDCLYYVVSGWIFLGRTRIDTGGGFLVLADRPYGYRAGSEGATVLEFRKSTSFNMVVSAMSPNRWQEIIDAAQEHEGWPGFSEAVALPRQ